MEAVDRGEHRPLTSDRQTVLAVLRCWGASKTGHRHRADFLCLVPRELKGSSRASAADSAVCRKALTMGGGTLVFPENKKML